MKHLLLFLLLPITAFATVNEAQLLTVAKTELGQYGVLQKQEKGFTYVKVNDDYIHKLIDLVEEKGFQKPPYFRRADAPGAHISVLYEDEVATLPTIPKIGEIFHFTITGTNIVRSQDTEFYIITVSSPELEAYRTSLGLTPLLKNHQFHITVAVRPVSGKLTK